MGRALVLSGGGSVGAGWETGLAAGLAEGGVDLAAADLIVGTSAGSAVGVQIAAGHDMGAQVERYRQAAAKAAAGRPTGVLDLEADGAHRKLFERGQAAGKFDVAVGREIGRAALAADVLLTEEQVLHTYRYLKGQPWPAAFVCTCLDCDTGEFVPLDARSGAELDRGVAASCAIPGVYSPVTVAGRRLVDAGVLSATHLDLAAGHERVLFVNMVELPRGELEVIEAAGADLRTVEPDEASRAAVGDNAMEAGRTYDAVERGLEQGRRIAADVKAFWDGP